MLPQPLLWEDSCAAHGTRVFDTQGGDGHRIQPLQNTGAAEDVAAFREFDGTFGLGAAHVGVLADGAAVVWRFGDGYALGDVEEVAEEFYRAGFGGFAGVGGPRGLDGRRE